MKTKTFTIKIQNDNTDTQTINLFSKKLNPNIEIAYLEDNIKNINNGKSYENLLNEIPYGCVVKRMVFTVSDRMFLYKKIYFSKDKYIILLNYKSAISYFSNLVTVFYEHLGVSEIILDQDSVWTFIMETESEMLISVIVEY